MQVQNEEVTLRDSTIKAQLLAQSEKVRAAAAAKAAVDQVQAQAAVVQAQSLADEAADAVTLVDIESQTRARAVESIEARSRISLESRRLEIQAARNLGHAILDDEEAGERGSVHGLGSSGTDQWVRESRAGQGDNPEISQGGPLEELINGTSNAHVRLPLSNETDPPFYFSLSERQSEGVIPAVVTVLGATANDTEQQQQQ
jgi:hypothetical protein